MFYDFRIRFEISHVKLISKSLDILKSISKGELTRLESLFQENKKTYIETKLDLPEIFDLRMNRLNLYLSDMQYKHLKNKFLNVLQLGDFGFLLVDVKQKFIDTGIIMKNKRMNSIEINLTQKEVDLIKTACNLYWKTLVGDFNFISQITNFKTEESFIDDLYEAGRIAKNLAGENSELSVEDKFINRKAKWAYDICQCIDSINNDDTIKNVGTLPKIKIIKNG